MVGLDGEKLVDIEGDPGDDVVAWADRYGAPVEDGDEGEACPALQPTLAALAASIAAASVLPASGAEYPTRSVRMLVGFAPGGGTDTTARAIAQKMGASMGQQIIVDNRPGAGSNIAAEAAAKSPPDGYALFIGTVANAINATLYPKLAFDFARDFAPVVLTTAALKMIEERLA